MAIADMFLKIQGATGEASDVDHKGEIDVVAWSWGLQAPTSVSGQATGRATLSELRIVKHVDKSSTTLMTYVRNHKLIEEVQLVVRKAGKTPLEYFKIELKKARVTSLQTETEDSELIERLTLGFAQVRVTYTPQDPTGAQGGGASMFEGDAMVGSPS
jgi:type VI secretion system secreted protein Hcp